MSAKEKSERFRLNKILKNQSNELNLASPQVGDLDNVITLPQLIEEDVDNRLDSLQVEKKSKKTPKKRGRKPINKGIF